MRATWAKMLTAGTAGLIATTAIPVAVLAFGSTSAGAADEMPSSLVEDYSYPGAAAIPDITLIKGDGRITLVECDSSNLDLITVESIGRTVHCFAVKGDTGWLSLRLDRVFLVGAGDQMVNAKFTANGVSDAVDIKEGGIESIGVGDPDFGVLLELRATPKA